MNLLGNASTPKAKLEWTCMDDASWKLDDYSLKPVTPPAHHTVEADGLEYSDFALAISGDVFRWMINHAPLETLQRVSSDTKITQIFILITYSDACQDADLCSYVT